MNNIIKRYIFCLLILIAGILQWGAKSTGFITGQDAGDCEKVITYHGNSLEEFDKQYPADVSFLIDPVKKTLNFISTIEGMGKVEINAKILSADCNLDLKTKTGAALYHVAKLGSDKDDGWVKIEFIKEKLVITLPRKKDSKENLGKYFIDRYKE